MEIKRNVIIFTSKCPQIETCHSAQKDEQRRRAGQCLTSIKAAIQSLDGEISDYGIDCEDRGLEVEEGLGVDKDEYRWNYVTKFTISHLKYGGEKLQDYIDRLIIQAGEEIDLVPTAEGAAG